MAVRTPWALLLLTLAPGRAAWTAAEVPVTMDTLSADRVTVRFPAGCEGEARRCLVVAREARATFRPLFRSAPAPELQVYWLPRSEWSQHTGGRFGMPTAAGKDTVVLPATNLELPEACVEIIAPLTDLRVLTREEVRDFMRTAPGGHGPSRRAFAAYLGSPAFYTDFMVDFVLPHEVMHVMCENAGIHRAPVWPYEGLAQWSADCYLRQHGRQDLARFYHLLYRMFYLAGKDDPANRSLERFGNYAWFHGQLTVMSGELEDELGAAFVPRLIRLAEARAAQRPAPTSADWVAILGEAAGKDMSGWFDARWPLE
jgi:hypothetical protein